MPTTARYLELFHLAFLTDLRPQPGRSTFVLKGGGNLRYFYRGIRYSQDVDLDVLHGSVETVQATVARALAARPLAATLAARGVAVRSWTEAKQTETTQRWKIELEIRLEMEGGGHELAPTKIEFSARGEALDYLGETATEFVAPEVVRPHGIRPPLLTHYLPAPAIVQKVRTLGERRQVQSRDIFDLELLFRGHPDVDLRGRLTDAQLRAAIDRVYEVPYEAYRQQVVAYLDDDYVEAYDDPRQWAQIQVAVIERLAALR